ncbi:unnamed protein product [Somion occarium]|uniref:Methyltransferase domain-containing protein n=1 Tax=Somion occarium TaxID=3059160 RepID=A0ABP1DW65_9APHY
MPEITKEIQLDPSVIPPLDPSLLSLSEQEKEFLHATISSDDEALKKKVYEVQKIAYAQHAYPCIRAFHFVNLMMSENPIYPRVLEAGKGGNTLLLDLGCCMGTDVRKLVYDGYPANRVIGCDLRQDFIDQGYHLFGDKDTSPIRFFTGDIFDVPVKLAEPSGIVQVDTFKITGLEQLRGALTHFYAGALFHLFDEPTQYELACRVATLVKLEPGTVVFGRHQALPEERLIDDHLGRTRYGHSPQSWAKLWIKVIGELRSPEFAESHVKVEAFLNEGFNVHVFQARHQTHMLVWSIKSPRL